MTPPPLPHPLAERWLCSAPPTGAPSRDVLLVSAIITVSLSVTIVLCGICQWCQRKLVSGPGVGERAWGGPGVSWDGGVPATPLPPGDGWGGGPHGWGAGGGRCPPPGAGRGFYLAL